MKILSLIINAPTKLCVNIADCGGCLPEADEPHGNSEPTKSRAALPRGARLCWRSVICLGLSVLFLTSCSDIEYPPPGIDRDEISVATGSGENTSVGVPTGEDSFRLFRYDVTPTPFSAATRFEPARMLSVTANPSYEDVSSLTVPVTLNAAQHYRIGITARAPAGNGVVALSAGGVVFGAFYVAGDYETAEDGTVIESDYFLRPIYLPAGDVELTFTLLRGTVVIDRVMTNNVPPLPIERFSEVSSRTVTPFPSDNAHELFTYLRGQYGERIVSAQHVTSGHNAEIDAIFAATGRRPAVRFADLAAVFGESRDTELSLAQQWHSTGGIVGYTWAWTSPCGADSVFANETEFSLSAALTGAEESGAIQMDSDFIAGIAEAGEITSWLVQIVHDMDIVAAALTELRDAGVPVLFNPIPDGGSRLYWWGESGESFVRLWRLLCHRLTEFHGLDNLIWVWSGGNHSHYPGENYVDIISESVFSGDGAIAGESIGSEAVRLSYIADYGTASQNKLAAVGRSRGIPSPDVLRRDNAMWLMWGLYKGDFVIDTDGRLLPPLENSLNRFYNHELTITLDQLPGAERQ